MFSDQPSILLSWMAPRPQAAALLGYISTWGFVLKNSSSDVISHKYGEAPAVNPTPLSPGGGASQAAMLPLGGRHGSILIKAQAHSGPSFQGLGRYFSPKLNYIQGHVIPFTTETARYSDASQTAPVQVWQNGSPRLHF